MLYIPFAASFRNRSQMGNLKLRKPQTVFSYSLLWVLSSKVYTLISILIYISATLHQESNIS